MIPVEAITAQPLVTVSASAPESSTACTEVSPKSRVEKFLADSWNNLIKVREKPKDMSSNNVSKLQPKRRGRPVSDLAWLPPGWERFTKTRSSGQTDTFYREIATNRTMRSAYDVISYVEFGKIIRKGKQRVKPILQAKYGVKFPRERRRTRGNETCDALAPPPPPPPGNVAETSDGRHRRQECSY